MKESATGYQNYTIYYYYDANGSVTGFSLNGTDYYYGKNIQGDVKYIYNLSGSVVAEYCYDAWGKLISILDANGNTLTSGINYNIATINPFRYRGYYYDTETGFYYLNSRYYDPQVGRFINADDTSILVVEQGNVSQYNLYAYCLNNPINMADENGYLPFFIVTGAIGAIAGGIIGAITTKSWKGALAGAAIGGAIGLTGGAAAGYLLAGKVTASVGAVIIGGKLFIAGVGTTGYATFELFKRAFGNAGWGKAWHHIVGQTTENISKFGAQVIHNAKNIVKISHGAGTLHNMISGHYKSIQKYTNGLRVYQWLQTKSFEFQYNYGLEKLKEFAEQIGAKIEFVK